MTAIELAPIVKSIDVKRSAQDAFRLFTEEIRAWWHVKSHSRARDADGERTIRVDIEPQVGGRIYETLNTGETREWGEVLIYQPHSLFRFLFQLGRPKENAGEVEVRFEPLSETTCRVTLIHEHWERLGDDAAEVRGRYYQGWDFVFTDSFGNYAGLADGDAQ